MKFCLNNAKTKGICLENNEGQWGFGSLFGLSGGFGTSAMETSGLVFLDTDAGRFEYVKWQTISAEQTGNTLTVVQQAGGIFEITLTGTLHEQTGVIRWKLTLRNLDNCKHVIYACLPRFVLQGRNYEVYGQFSAWCAENQGAWMDLKAGNLVLTNSEGCSCTSSVPFACVRDKATGFAFAVHVLPVGDWIIKLRSIAASRKSFTVLEAGLSDASLRMEIAAGEELCMPEILMHGFQGEISNCGIMLQRYLLDTYGSHPLPPVVYNTWFYDFDTLEPENLKQQAQAAKKIGCKVFVVDAGWFGTGKGWSNQVGCWEECTERAFHGKMQEFADYVRSLGMGFGIWMEPQRAGTDAPVYKEHPDWFIPSDDITYDLRKDEVIDYLAEQTKKVIQKYGAVWMKVDYNNNMLRDLLGDNFYSYYLGERKLQQKLQQQNPDCTFEGCSGGGRRTDIGHVMQFYHGHFLSDTVHPYEVLRIRQNAVPRLLPAYLGSWLVLQEVPFPVVSYSDRDRSKRNKIYACGDAWWDHTVDADLDFAIYANQMGEYGFSGDLTSLSDKTVARLQQATDFYEAHRAFMSRTVCHLLTEPQPLNSIEGWVAMQYENVDGEGSILYVFRMVDDKETFYLYPRNLEQEQKYKVYMEDEDLGVHTGAELMQNGIAVYCNKRYRAKMIQILPVEI